MGKNDDSQIKAFCLLCFVLGRVTPWLLLVAGAGLAMLSSSEVAGAVSAWLVLAGLVLMALSVIVSRTVATLGR